MGSRVLEMGLQLYTLFRVQMVTWDLKQFLCLVDLEQGELLQKYEVSVQPLCGPVQGPAVQVRPALVGVGLYQGWPLQTGRSRCRWLWEQISLGDLRSSAVC